MTRCLDGDPEAWQKFFGRTHPFLLRVIGFLLGAGRRDGDAVEEIASRVWYALLRDESRTLARYEPDGDHDIGAYLIGVARREILHHLRSERRRSARELSAGREIPREQGSSEMEAWVLYGEFAAQLTPDERELLRTLLGAQPPANSEADGAGVAAGTIRQRRRRLRMKLEAFLAGS